MSEDNTPKYDKFYLFLSVLLGLFVGLIITVLCIYYNLTIFGVNIDIFIAPIIAGFVETFVSTNTRNKSSGAISSIILFFITNGIGWLFPSQPISFNIFTVGGFILMLQAAFPLLLNYIFIALFLVVTYIFGLIGTFIGYKVSGTKNSPTTYIEDIEEDDLKIHIFNSKPNIPIKEYHGLVCVEDVIDFDEKEKKDKILYMGSDNKQKTMIKLNDYSTSRKYIFKTLEKEAVKLKANAIIDVEFEYTNYNQQVPPDVVVAAYGTAVTVDENYLH